MANGTSKRRQNGSAKSANGSGAHAGGAGPTLDLDSTFEGRRLVVVGGTGFLGKVWWSFLLSRFPNVGHIYLVCREKKGKSAEERFRDEVLPTAVFDPLRQVHGDGFEAFIRDKVTPVPGDVVQPMCGLGVGLRDDLRQQIDAVVNVAGVVDFDPPLDEALEVNAFGMQNLVRLARDLGDVPLLHTRSVPAAVRAIPVGRERPPAPPGTSVRTNCPKRSSSSTVCREALLTSTRRSGVMIRSCPCGTAFA